MEKFFYDTFLFEVNADALPGHGNVCFVKERDKNSWVRLVMNKSNGNLRWVEKKSIPGKPPKGALIARPTM